MFFKLAKTSKVVFFISICVLCIVFIGHMMRGLQLSQDYLGGEKKKKEAIIINVLYP